MSEESNVPERDRIVGGIGADEPYWEYLEQGEFRLPRCAGCHQWMWPAHFRCGECGSWDQEWVQREPTGVGVGQTPYYKRGTSPDPEIKLALRAIVDACEDAGVSPRDVDGFVSYGSEKNDGQRLMPALGTRELRFGALVWTHGGGIPGA